MLISDSMPLLWLIYAVLSLVVLGTGYMGLAFLPRLPRLVITWMVAGIMWVPSSFSTPINDQGDIYTGVAPAVVVAGLAFLEGDTAGMGSSLLLVAVAAVIGGLLGVLLWRRKGGKAQRGAAAKGRQDDQQDGQARREPVVG
ncbi:hypothetical protein [Halomonas halmophila]|uniref:Uncharacterized protein n=1 Tax=Halomonas halmophila TaxID=252 RepID=A0A4Y4F3W5_9GAMM|nr:hypothetical protein [Halomonas halmophila]GED21788.1 hypothetical protein HHA01_07650 [Halomonas halmophila]